MASSVSRYQEERLRISGQGVDVFYWREGNTEIDFVVRKANRVTALEIKSGSPRGSRAGLTAFTKRYASAKTLTVGGPEFSLQEFLEAPLPQGIFLGA